jgi:Pyridine nucleotide-disulphide oxidoreductase, dimerisation domain
MVYKNIATAVFTPLEIGTVGLTEDEATAKFGSDVDYYVSAYHPLEWSVCHKEEIFSFAKIVINRTNDTVLGIHSSPAIHSRHSQLQLRPPIASALLLPRPLLSTSRPLPLPSPEPLCSFVRQSLLLCCFRDLTL